MARLRMAVVGVGHLGKEHARVLAGMPDVELVGIADVNADQANAVARRLGTTSYHDYWPLLNLVDATCVVVPTTQHYAVASEFLHRGIPVLVEKPLAATLEQADALVELACKHGVPLQVGHIERFNPAFEDLERRSLRPKFVSCARLGPFSGRSMDIGVVLDLMIHDLDLLLTLVRAPVSSVEAVGVSLFGQHEDVANARLHFANGCIADVTSSRASPAAQRRMHVWAAEGYARVDFARRHLTLMQPSARLRSHDLDKASLTRLKDELFSRHVEVLELDRNDGDQLMRELQDFVTCLRTGRPPRVSGLQARDAMELATRVLSSINQHAWEGAAEGPTGPLHLPLPRGQLFPPRQDDVAA
jgi:predicted dehydrogenase